MSQFDGDFKVGDIVIANYHSGYYQISKIEQQFVTQEMKDSKFHKEAFKDRNVGDELRSRIFIKRIFRNNGKRIKHPHEFGFFIESDLTLAKKVITKEICKAERNIQEAKDSLTRLINIASGL